MERNKRKLNFLYTFWEKEQQGHGWGSGKLWERLDGKKEIIRKNIEVKCTQHQSYHTILTLLNCCHSVTGNRSPMLSLQECIYFGLLKQGLIQPKLAWSPVCSQGWMTLNLSCLYVQSPAGATLPGWEYIFKSLFRKVSHLASQSSHVS